MIVHRTNELDRAEEMIKNKYKKISRIHFNQILESDGI